MTLLRDRKALGIFAAGVLVGVAVFFIGIDVERAHASTLAQQIICLEYGINNGIIGNLVTLTTDSCGSNATSSQTVALTVIKHVDNTGGGTAQASDFTMQVSGTNPSATSFPGSETGSVVALDPGSYSVTEVASSSYSMSQSSGCSGTLTAGQTATCTITNTYIVPPPTPHATSSDLSVLKSVSSSTPTQGSDITYTIAVHNAGPDDAANVSVSDVLPSGVSYVSDTGAGAYATTTGLWSIGTLTNGATTTLGITVLVGSTTSAITNTASIAGQGGTDPAAGNNSSSVTITPAAVATSTPPSGGGGGETDMCPNIDGVQASVPEGDVIVDGNCVADSSNNNGGGGGGGGGGNGSNPVIVPPGNGGGNGSPSLIGQVTPGGGLVLGTSTEVTTCGPLLTTYLRMGKVNDSSEVKKLQTFLNNLMGAKLPVTGFFGTLTDAAVRKFQLSYGGDVLAPWVPYGLPTADTSTGYVYKTTQRMINNLYCKSLDLPLPKLP